MNNATLTCSYVDTEFRFACRWDQDGLAEGGLLFVQAYEHIFKATRRHLDDAEMVVTMDADPTIRTTVTIDPQQTFDVLRPVWSLQDAEKRAHPNVAFDFG